MYSVYLVEDEIVIREGVRRLVSWEEYGFSFIGEAADGELAWPAIQKLRPDIVITDIRMPFMDGLDLSRLIKKELPRTIVIILSGHDDFAYAREAIGIGVNQFLLKPLSKDQLVDVLMELKTKKDNELRLEQYNAQFAGEVQEYLTSSRRGFFDTLVSGDLSVSELLIRAEKLGLNLAAERYTIVLFLLEEEILNDNYSSTIARVQDEITQTFFEAEHVVMFSAGMDVTAFLVKAGEEDILDATQECVETLNRICQPLVDRMRWATLAGQPVSRLSAVADCYRSVRKALFYRGEDRNEETLDVASNHALWDTFPIDFDPDVFNTDNMDFQIISKFLSNGLQEDVDGFLEDYFNGFGAKGMKSIVFRHYIILNLQFSLNAFLKRIGAKKIKYGGETGKQDVKEAIDSRDGLHKYASALLSEALLLRDHAVSGQRRMMLQDVLSFMEDNYADPEINLNTVAKVANVTPTHFSALFSQQMGKTFVEYLTELRMENARELLRCTGDGSGEIALKVGYNDPHYFSFLFKKVNGCSPRDYRSKVR